MTEKMPKKEQAAKVGELIAKRRLQEAGITTVVFDRNGYLYHGRVKKKWLMLLVTVDLNFNHYGGT